MTTPKIGLLPLYLQFYDTALPGLAERLLPHVHRVQDALQSSGVEVIAGEACRTRPEVARAVERFESASVDAIVTLHLAYSPSLESAPVLAESRLPVILLDTTPDRDFGSQVNPLRLLENHGIHGLQDLASVLRRLGKPFRVIAGHLDDPSVTARCLQAVQAARAAQALRAMRVLRIGGSFPGMGDFAVPSAVLRSVFGITVEDIAPAGLSAVIETVTEEEIAAELAADRVSFRIACDETVHARSVRIGLGLRRYVQDGGFGAFSLNFLAFQEAQGPVNSVPFLECCKAMARGTGYAGEGDALTAALVGCLLHGIGPATFAEMFCPDWAGESIFLSHMGEFNPAVAAARPVLYEKEYSLSPARNPATLACAPRPGPATLVNLAPGPNDSFRLIAAPVAVLALPENPEFDRWVRGWIRPAIPVAKFLEDYSHLGGTHHSALLPGTHLDALAHFSALLGIEHSVIS